MACRPAGRRGVSLLEVLFAIVVTTVGLLGAIAIFPVASSRARQARINDASAVAGRSAVHAFDTRGMRRFDRWYFWDANPAVGPRRFISVTAKLSTGGALRGQAYCIDSRFLVRNTGNINPGVLEPRQFPYVSPLNPLGSPLWPRMERVAFFPGELDPSTPSASPRDQFDRRNLTTNIGLEPVSGRNLLLADSIFVLDDDLVFVRPGRDEVAGLGLPADRSLPAVQLFDRLSSGAPSQRSSQGRFSWMATVVPKVEPNSVIDEYVLSIVVFHDRPTDLFLTPYAAGGNENILERMVNVTFSGDGTSGGEVLLSVPTSAYPGGTLSAQEFAEQRLKVRTGDWLLLAGRRLIPGTTPTAIDRFQWYRVVHVDPDVILNTAANRFERYVTLMGRDWDTSLSLTYALLMEGVVGVYEKTIRLEYGSSF